MLSFTDGTPIAIIKNGKYHNKIIYINEDSNTNIIEHNPLDVMDNIFDFNKKKMSRDNLNTIINSLKTNMNVSNNELYEIIEKIRKQSQEISKKELIIYDDGIIIPLPRFNKTDRAYIAGKTDSGKSYYLSKFLKQLNKVEPNKTIYLFSDVDKDPEVDKLKNLVRFKLDEGLLKKKPIDVNKFSNSVCVFDDIDSIQNTKMLKYIQKLRDSILRRGRHENISCIVTNHLLTNYQDTRIVLNECSSMTFFCRGTAPESIKYALKRYGGLNMEQIKKFVNLPSRWQTLYINYPPYVLYEKGIYVL